MKKFIKDHRFISGVLSVVTSVFVVSLVAYGATTIGTNIVTTGTSSSTSATTTAYLYVGEDIAEPTGWNFSGGDLIVSGLAYFHTKATTTTALAVGAGTINALDMAGGDLYVQDDLEVDGFATSTTGFYSMGVLEIGGNGLIRGKATTTTALAIGAGTINALDMTGGDLYVQDDLEVDGFATSTTGFYSMGVLEIGGNGLIRGKATTTTALAIGAGTINALDMTGGDLYVQDDLEVDGFATTTSALNTQGNLHVGGTVTIDGIATTTSHIYLPNVKFQQGAATSSLPQQGECFMPNNDLKCYDGASWQYAW